MKVCRRCKVSKPFLDYYFDKRSRDGYYYWCKDCHNLSRSISKKPKENKALELAPAETFQEALDVALPEPTYSTLTEAQRNLPKEELQAYFSANYPITIDQYRVALKASGRRCESCKEVYPILEPMLDTRSQEIHLACEQCYLNKYKVSV